jgi:hypothetical protein
MPLFTLAALDYPFCQCYKNGLRDFAGRDFFAKTLSTEGHAFKKKTSFLLSSGVSESDVDFFFPLKN